MFRTSVVHLQERSYAVCCNLVCLDTSCSSFTLITTGRIETYQTATYTIRTLLKMDYWSPKHVELLNVMNKINHQILRILLDYRYIAKWYTVHTISNYTVKFLTRLVCTWFRQSVGCVMRLASVSSSVNNVARQTEKCILRLCLCLNSTTIQIHARRLWCLSSVNSWRDSQIYRVLNIFRLWMEWGHRITSNVRMWTAVSCVRSALFWDVTQRRVVIAYRRFGTILSRLQE